MLDFLKDVGEYVIKNPKDFVNICFWTITAFLAIGTYYNAKKTLFNPIRSEMVKYQMKIITEFVDNHTSKGRNFDNSADYSKLLQLNYETDYLFDIQTPETEFKNLPSDEIDKERLKFCKQNLGGLFELSLKEDAIIMDIVYGDFETAKLYVQTKYIRDKELNNIKLTLQRVYLTNTFYSFYTDLLNLKLNPFIPIKIKDSIDRIISNIYRNVMLLHELLSFHIAEQTDARYQLIYSQFTERKIDHQKDLEKLRESISKHFKVN